MKGYVRCEDCGRTFLIDEVDYTYIIECKDPMLCEDCGIGD